MENTQLEANDMALFAAMTGYPNEDEGPDEVKWEEPHMTEKTPQAFIEAKAERDSGWPEITAEKPEHTPLPWRVFKTPDGLRLVGVGADDGEGILDAGFGVWAWDDAAGIANAELVVRSVNAFPDLMKALEAIRQRIYGPANAQMWDIRQIVDAALAKVKP